MYKRIKELRTTHKLSQEEFGRAVGCSQNMIRKIELGETFPRADVLKRMCEFFFVSSDYILGISDDPCPVLIYPGIWDEKFCALTGEQKRLVLQLIDAFGTRK